MQRTVNMVIGLAVVVGVSVILFGSIGGKSSSSRRDSPPPSSGSGPIGGLPQLDMANDIVGPSSSEPPPIPSTARFSPPPGGPYMRERLADPARLVDERWERARRRIRTVFGGALAPEKEAAVQAAVATWVGMQAHAAAAYYDGYIDSHGLGLHSGWNRNVYMLSLQDALGNTDFQRYAGGGVELEEIDPNF